MPPAPAAEEPEPEVAPPPTASPPKRSAIPVPDGPLKMDFSKYRYPAAPVLKLAKLPAVKQEDLLEDYEVPQYETSKLVCPVFLCACVRASIWRVSIWRVSIWRACCLCVCVSVGGL